MGGVRSRPRNRCGVHPASIALVRDWRSRQLVEKGNEAWEAYGRLLRLLRRAGDGGVKAALAVPAGELNRPRRPWCPEASTGGGPVPARKLAPAAGVPVGVICVCIVW